MPADSNDSPAVVALSAALGKFDASLIMLSLMLGIVPALTSLLHYAPIPDATGDDGEGCEEYPYAPDESPLGPWAPEEPGEDDE